MHYILLGKTRRTASGSLSPIPYIKINCSVEIQESKSCFSLGGMNIYVI